MTNKESYITIDVKYIRHIKGGIRINNLAKYRKKKNFSQLELAKLVDVSRQTISMIENNNYNPSLKLCINICLILNVTLNDIFWKE